MPISDSDPRVFFAAERTLLAWLRTGLTIIALGFVVSRFGLFVRLLVMQSQGSSPASPLVGGPRGRVCRRWNVGHRGCRCSTSALHCHPAAIRFAARLLQDSRARLVIYRGRALGVALAAYLLLAQP